MSDETPLVFTFQLRSAPLQVHKGGEVEFATEIEFSGPTSKNLTECSQLKQAISRAMVEVQKSADPEAVESAKASKGSGDSTITGEDLLQAVSLSTIPLEEVLAVGQKLVTSGVGKVLGDVKFSITMAQTLPLEELERMVGEYAINFPLKSLLS
jgi:hypothetical protein